MLNFLLPYYVENLVITVDLVLSGNAEDFCRHTFRVFDRDGNDMLDFKEFLMAIDIATCETGT